MRHTFRHSLAAGALAAAAAGFAPRQTVAVPFQLNWMAGGPNAGLRRGRRRGLLQGAGLDVTIIQGNGSGNTAQLVANGRAQLAYADAVAVSQLIAKGAPMKIVATVYQSNPNAVMALKKTGIKSVADLKGKKVGVPSGSSQTTMLPLLLKSNNLKESDITMIDMPVASMVPALLQGQVDAVLGLDRRVPDPGRGAGRAARRLPVRRPRRADRQHVDLREQRYLKTNPESRAQVRRGEPQGLELRARQPGQDDQGRQGRVPRGEREARRGRARRRSRRCSAAAGAKYLGQGRGRAVDQVAGAPAPRSSCCPAGQDPKTYYTNDFLPPDSQMRACKS
jgi:NitT/TauT family transport system substrate-binding protein